MATETVSTSLELVPMLSTSQRENNDYKTNSPAMDMPSTGNNASTEHTNISLNTLKTCSVGGRFLFALFVALVLVCSLI